MQPSTSYPRRGSLAVLGGLLVIAGGTVLLLEQLGYNITWSLGESSWPLLVIVPGVFLLALAFVPAPPNGVGFAIAGSIVTTVGLLLAYQEATNYWESWAYAWALVGPTAAGVGMLAYGLVTRHWTFIVSGLRTATIGLVIFGLGAWFFETIFRTGRAPFDVADWWPFVLIGIGIVVVLEGILPRPHRRDDSAAA